jgi:hypothetical protein
MPGSPVLIQLAIYVMIQTNSERKYANFLLPKFEHRLLKFRMYPGHEIVIEFVWMFLNGSQVQN